MYEENMKCHSKEGSCTGNAKNTREGRYIYIYLYMYKELQFFSLTKVEDIRRMINSLPQ